MITAAKVVFGEMLNLVVWAKTNAGLGSLYRSQHELICVFRVDRARHRNNVELVALHSDYDSLEVAG